MGGRFGHDILLISSKSPMNGKQIKGHESHDMYTLELGLDFVILEEPSKPI